MKPKQIDDTPVACAERIRLATERISRLCQPITEMGKAKAQAEVDYECAIEKAIVNLQSEGQPATLTEKLAKGRCQVASLNTKMTEINYKSQIVKIHAAESILNGFQSMNRYLDKV